MNRIAIIHLLPINNINWATWLFDARRIILLTEYIISSIMLIFYHVKFLFLLSFSNVPYMDSGILGLGPFLILLIFFSVNLKNWKQFLRWQ